MNKIVAVEYDICAGGQGIVITYYADGTCSVASPSGRRAGMSETAAVLVSMALVGAGGGFFVWSYWRFIR
jgi:hypothetical protein